LPRLTAAWQVMDCLLLARDMSELYPVQIQAMRQWLVSGARLWSMLNRVDEAIWQTVLGNDFQVVMVDRTQLTDLKVSGQNVFADGVMTVPVDRQNRLPRGWTIPSQATVDIHSNATRIVTEDQDSEALLTHSAELDPQWT